MNEAKKCEVVKTHDGRFYCNVHLQMVEPYADVAELATPVGTPNTMVPVYRCPVGGAVEVTGVI